MQVAAGEVFHSFPAVNTLFNAQAHHAEFGSVDWSHLKLSVGVGMAYEEVTALLGKPAECNEALGLRACHWGDEQRSADITFAGGKVLIASAKNLR